MPSLKRSLIVRQSNIHGEGLFTTIDLPRDVTLGICSVKKAQTPGPHTLWIENDRLVDVTCKLKFINHSKRPNVAYLEDLRVITLRKIRAGEELTHDYGEEWK